MVSLLCRYCVVIVSLLCRYCVVIVTHCVVIVTHCVVIVSLLCRYCVVIVTYCVVIVSLLCRYCVVIVTYCDLLCRYCVVIDTIWGRWGFPDYGVGKAGAAAINSCVHPALHSGMIQRTIREHSGNIQWTLRAHSGNKEHSGNIQGTSVPAPRTGSVALTEANCPIGMFGCFWLWPSPTQTRPPCSLSRSDCS
jgi:hypothetical protein